MCADVFANTHIQMNMLVCMLKHVWNACCESMDKHTHGCMDKATMRHDNTHIWTGVCSHLDISISDIKLTLTLENSLVYAASWMDGEDSRTPVRKSDAEIRRECI